MDSLQMLDKDLTLGVVQYIQPLLVLFKEASIY